MSNRQQKRRASGEPLSSRPTKRGRQTESIHPRDRALAHATKLAAEHSPGNIDEVTIARLFRKRPIDWTASDEEIVTDQWNVSIVKESSKRLTRSQHSILLNLWKTSSRIYGIDPVKLISPLFYMRYQALVPPKAAMRDDDYVIYSPKFCSVLSSLMVHPCFEEDADKLIQALHYAIVCRLDDREMWPCDQDVGTDCPALHRLLLKLKACGNSEPPESIHRMHASARARVLQKGKTPSSWSDFLYHLGETVSKNDARRPAVDPKYRREMGQEVLPLTLWDLQQIVTAIDTIKFSTREWRFSVAEANSAWNLVKSSRQEAPSMNQLRSLYELYTKDLFRLIRLRETGRDLTIQTPPESENEEESEEESERESEEESQEESEVATSQGRSSNQTQVVDPDSPFGSTAVSSPTRFDDRLSDSHEYGNNHDDDGTTGTANWLDGQVHSMITSTRHLVRPNVPHTVQGQSQLPMVGSVEENGSAPPILSSTHDTIMYKCLQRENKELRARVASLEHNNRHLSCDATAKQERIKLLESQVNRLESEVDRLSEDTGKTREEVQILSEERLELLDKFETLERNVEGLKTQVTSGTSNGMSPYNLFGGARGMLSDYLIRDTSERDSQRLLPEYPARTSRTPSEHESVHESTKSAETSKSRETEHRSTSGLDVEPEGCSLAPETENQSVSGNDARPEGSSPAPEVEYPAPEVPLEHEMTSEIDLPTNYSEHAQETSVPEQKAAHIISPEPDTIMGSDQANDMPGVAEEVRHSKPVRSINTVKPRQYVSHGGIGSIGRRAPFSSTMKHTFRMSRVDWLERVVQHKS